MVAIDWRCRNGYRRSRFTGVYKKIVNKTINMTSIEFCSQLVSLEHSLLRFAYRFNLKKEDAKDLVQDTFLRALIKKEKYVDNQKFKAWTFTIMKHTFVDNYRHSLSKNPYRDRPVESLFINQSASAASEDPDSAYSVLEIVQNIEQLEDKFRVPFKMYVDGYKYTEIADELDLKIGTVKNRIFLSRKQLMSQLNG
jgi:RNA polymerase sigma factor (sigma-70 family)